MKVEHTKTKLPLDYDPYEECFAGSYSAEKLTINDGGVNIALILEIEEFKSGLGPSYTIKARTSDGQVGRITVHAFVDDDGELSFYGENKTAI
jgi:hypothetical protein